MALESLFHMLKDCVRVREVWGELLNGRTITNFNSDVVCDRIETNVNPCRNTQKDWLVIFVITIDYIWFCINKLVFHNRW